MLYVLSHRSRASAACSDHNSPKLLEKIDMIERLLGGVRHRMLASRGAERAFTVAYAVAGQLLVGETSQVLLGRVGARFALRRVVLEHTRHANHTDGLSVRGSLRAQSIHPVSSAAARTVQQRGLAHASDHCGLHRQATATACRCHEVIGRQQ